MPCSLQGEIEAFEISVRGLNEENHHDFHVTLPVQSNFDKNQDFSISLRELKAEYNYTYEVSAVTVNKHGKKFKGENATLKAYHPAGSKIQYRKFQNSVKIF